MDIKKSTKKVFIILIVLSLGSVLIIFGLFTYAQYRLTPIYDVIATDGGITTELQEFVPENPMKVKRQTQSVDLNIVGYKFVMGEPLPWRIALQDGTIVKPEVQIIDEYGNTYELHDSGRVGDTILFKPEISGDRYTTFPEDRKYVKVRIRSDVPFRFSRMVWTNKDLK